MKKRQLFTSVFLVLVLFCTAAFFSFAEMSLQTSSKINSDGSYTLVVSATEDEGEVFYQWYTCNSSGSTIAPVSGATESVLNAEAEEENSYYLCRITYLTEEGEQSMDSSVFTVEAKPEEKKVVEIMTFAVDGIDKPITSMNPDTTAMAVGSSAAGYSITSVSWDPKTSSFQPETTYTVTITVKLNEGYEAGQGYKCTINGQTAVSNGSTSGDTIEFYYTFPATEPAAPTEIVVEEEPETPLGLPGFVWILIILAIIAALAVLIIKSRNDKKMREARRRNLYEGAEAYNEKIRQAEEAEQDLNELRRIRALDRENIQKNKNNSLEGGAVYGAEMTEQEAVHRKKIRETVEEPMDRNGSNLQPETTGYKGGNVSLDSSHQMAGAKTRSTKETIIMSKDSLDKNASSDTINMKKSDIENEIREKNRKSKPYQKKEESFDNGSDVSYFDDSEIDNKYF